MRLRNKVSTLIFEVRRGTAGVVLTNQWAEDTASTHAVQCARTRRTRFACSKWHSQQHLMQQSYDDRIEMDGDEEGMVWRAKIDRA
jgi:hypothetical protein